MVERITNGTFDSDTSGWTQAAPTLAWDAGGGDGQASLTTFAAPAAMDQQIVTVPQQQHDFTMNVRAFTTGSNDRARIQIGTAQGLGDLLDVTYDTTGVKNETFTPTGITSWVRISGFDSLSDAGGAEIDDVSVDGPAGGPPQLPPGVGPTPSIRANREVTIEATTAGDATEELVVREGRKVHFSVADTFTGTIELQIRFGQTDVWRALISTTVPTEQTIQIAVDAIVRAEAVALSAGTPRLEVRRSRDPFYGTI